MESKFEQYLSSSRSKRSAKDCLGYCFIDFCYILESINNRSFFDTYRKFIFPNLETLVLNLVLTRRALWIMTVNLLSGRNLVPTKWHKRQGVVQTESIGFYRWFYRLWLTGWIDNFGLLLYQLVPFLDNFFSSWAVHWIFLKNPIGKVMNWPNFLILR